MSVYMLRLHVGRWLIHTGLKALPPGKVKTEVTAVLQAWGDHVRATVTANWIDEALRDPKVRAIDAARTATNGGEDERE